MTPGTLPPGWVVRRSVPLSVTDIDILLPALGRRTDGGGPIDALRDRLREARERVARAQAEALLRRLGTTPAGGGPGTPSPTPPPPAPEARP